MLARLASLVALLTVCATSAHARADCEPARASSVSALPPRWKAAAEGLVRSVNEPGHPWSCSGGTVELTLSERGAVLKVARAGEAPIARSVAEPDDVVPLGQALLAAPLEPPAEEEAEAPAPPPPPPPFVPAIVVPADRVVTVTPRREPRLLLGGGVDARGVGGSGLAWTGVAIHAGVPMGRWLPSLALRQQSALFVDGPSIDELSVAIALQYRIPIRNLELRAGPAVRGAVVLRDLPRPQGEQSQLQTRVGGVTSLVIPVVRIASFLVWLDGDVVALSRETTSPTTTTTSSRATPKAFPTFTLGGGIGVEVAL